MRSEEAINLYCLCLIGFIFVGVCVWCGVCTGAQTWFAPSNLPRRTILWRVLGALKNWRWRCVANSPVCCFSVAKTTNSLKRSKHMWSQTDGVSLPVQACGTSCVRFDKYTAHILHDYYQRRRRLPHKNKLKNEHNNNHTDDDHDDALRVEERREQQRKERRRRGKNTRKLNRERTAGKKRERERNENIKNYTLKLI